MKERIGKKPQESENLLPSGTFEDGDTVVAAGWQHMSDLPRALAYKRPPPWMDSPAQ